MNQMKQVNQMNQVNQIIFIFCWRWRLYLGFELCWVDANLDGESDIQEVENISLHRSALFSVAACAEWVAAEARLAIKCQL